MSQSAEPAQRSVIAAEIRALGDFTVLEMDRTPCKAAAIQLGLCASRGELALLLDADTALVPSAVEALVNAAEGHDAAYGIISPHNMSRSGLLHEVVKTEKLFSHGAWRPGRWSLGIGPNLPGQCYVGRVSLLRDLYRNDLGLLDDVALTARLIARRASINFAPTLVALERSRSTWTGLLLQRGRYTIGLVQAFAVLFRAGSTSAWAFTCLCIHAWLYYLSCIGAVALVVACVISRCWIVAAVVLIFFVLNRLAVGGIAARVLQSMNVATAAFWPKASLVPSVLLLALAKTLGVFLALTVYFLGYPARGVTCLYRR